jgi:hypothetical protein
MRSEFEFEFLARDRSGAPSAQRFEFEAISDIEFEAISINYKYLSLLRIQYYRHSKRYRFNAGGI